MRYRMFRHMMIGCLWAIVPLKGSAQQLAVGSDVALLATQTYNAALELTVSGRSTLGVSVMGNYHPWVHQDMRLIGILPEWRFYFSGRPMLYHYVGMTGLLANYDFDGKGEAHHGAAAGVGLTFGYVVPLSQRWNLDLHAGAGWIWYHEKSQTVGTIILPLKLGVSLAYIIR